MGSINPIMERIGRQICRVQRCNHKDDTLPLDALAVDIHDFLYQLQEYHNFDIVHINVYTNLSVKIILSFGAIMVERNYSIDRALNDPHMEKCRENMRERLRNIDNKAAFDRAMKGI